MPTASKMADVSKINTGTWGNNNPGSFADSHDRSLHASAQPSGKPLAQTGRAVDIAPQSRHRSDSDEQSTSSMDTASTASVAQISTPLRKTPPQNPSGPTTSDNPVSHLPPKQSEGMVANPDGLISQPQMVCAAVKNSWVCHEELIHNQTQQASHKPLSLIGAVTDESLVGGHVVRSARMYSPHSSPDVSIPSRQVGHYHTTVKWSEKDFEPAKQFDECRTSAFHSNLPSHDSNKFKMVSAHNLAEKGQNCKFPTTGPDGIETTPTGGVTLELPDGFHQNWDDPKIKGNPSSHSWAAGPTAADDSESISSCNSGISAASAPTVLVSTGGSWEQASNTGFPLHPHSCDDANIIASSNKPWPPLDKVLMEAVRTALRWMPEDRTIPIFDFSMSEAAAEKNFGVLQSAGFDLQSIIIGDEFSPLRPGSEFRPVSILAPIFEGHPFWPRVSESLSNGASFPLEPSSDTDRLCILERALEYGNHKSASKHSESLLGMLTKEVTKGWHLPLPIDRLWEIPGLVVGPMGLVEQFSIDEEGKIVPKLRMTHDQSFTFKLEAIKSVNQRVLRDSLSRCVFGFALRRMAHNIVATRAIYTTTPILISKLDYKSAYRRMHLHAMSILQSVITTIGLSGDPIALASLQVTFGGRPSPFLFAELSKSTADLANALARCKLWDPKSVRNHHTPPSSANQSSKAPTFHSPNRKP